MKLNINLNKFKQNHKINKNQVLFKSRSCKDYSKVENLFKFLLAEKNSFILSLLKKGRLEEGIQ